MHSAAKPLYPLGTLDGVWACIVTVGICVLRAREKGEAAQEHNQGHQPANNSLDTYSLT